MCPSAVEKEELDEYLAKKTKHKKVVGDEVVVEEKSTLHSKCFSAA